MSVIALKCPEIKVNVVDYNADCIAAQNDINLENLTIYEPGLAEVVSNARGRNLFFSADIKAAIIDADMILELTKSKSKLIFQELQQVGPLQRQPDISLAKKKLDWDPRIKLEQGLIKTITYFKK